MKDKTLKLTGPGKDRFLERFFAAESGLDATAAKRLLARSRSTFLSIRVLKGVAYPPAQGIRRKPARIGPHATPHVPPSEPASLKPAAPAPSPAQTAAATPPAADPAFDAYAIGLVPTFQREGRDGLIAKLAAIDRLDHLRQMSKAQQIVLPADLRTGDASLDAVRAAIADAVAKRIADRRAAAG